MRLPKTVFLRVSQSYRAGRASSEGFVLIFDNKGTVSRSFRSSPRSPMLSQNSRNEGNLNVAIDFQLDTNTEAGGFCY